VVEEWLLALRRSSDRFAALTSSLSPEQLAESSYAEEWSNAQVAAHLGSYAEIFTRTLEVGLGDAPAPGPEDLQAIWDRWNALDPASQVEAGNRATAGFVAAVELLDAEERARFRFELFGDSGDLRRLVAMRLTEHALHSWDVAVSQDAAATLTPDAVELLIDDQDRLGAWLEPVPGLGPMTVVTTEPDRRFRLSFDPAIRIAPAEPADVVDTPLVMAAEAFLRLLFGRLDAAHARGVPADDRWVALRAAFPGF
jgi:uncharacterized protein (TIGR03083 family)